MKKMVLNKKAQGLPTSTLVLMIIAIIVLVFVVLGFVTGWGYIFDKMGLLPDDLTAAAQACGTYSSNEALKISFCELRELRIEGVKGYYDCNLVHDAASKIQALDWKTQTCPGATKEFCTNNKLKDNVLVNGVACSDLS